MKDWIWAYCGVLYLIVAMLIMFQWEINRKHARQIKELEQNVAKLVEQVKALEARFSNHEARIQSLERWTLEDCSLTPEEWR